MTGMSNVSKLAGEPSGQEFLVFTLGNEEYGIDILKVQEIRGYDQVTRIANTPAFIKGVTNLPRRDCPHCRSAREILRRRR